MKSRSFRLSFLVGVVAAFGGCADAALDGADSPEVGSSTRALKQKPKKQQRTTLRVMSNVWGGVSRLG